MMIGNQPEFVGKYEAEWNSGEVSVNHKNCPCIKELSKSILNLNKSLRDTLSKLETILSDRDNGIDNKKLLYEVELYKRIDEIKVKAYEELNNLYKKS